VNLVYRLAGQKDDPALRRLLASVAMPGSITVSFEREPDYFAAMRMSGEEWQVIVAEEAGSGELAGVLSRSVQQRFVNGKPARIAYWGQLRIAPRFQGSVFLPRAFIFGRGLHAASPVDGSFAVIADENPVARRLFAEKHGRLLPPFLPVTRILTFGISLGRRWVRDGKASQPATRARTQIMRGSDIALSAIASFLLEKGSEEQFYPVYGQDYFLACGLHPRDFVVASREGRIVGVAGVWDQSGCKQTVVRSYNGLLRIGRPAYNFAARLRGSPRLPALGRHIRSAYLGFIAVEGQDPEVFRAIIHEACRRATERGLAHLMVGLSEEDPLASVPRALPHIRYASTLYTVELSPDAPLHPRLDRRIPYIEIATL
jgi:hypothetical protein